MRGSGPDLSVGVISQVRRYGSGLCPHTRRRLENAVSVFRASSAFDRHAIALAAQPMIESELGVLSYAEAARRVRQICHGFTALGIGPDDRVAVVARNRAEVLLLILAAQQGGPVIVPINHRLAAEEIAWIVDDADAMALIVEDAFLERLDPMLRPMVPSGCRFCLGQAAGDWISFDAWLAPQADQAWPRPAALKPAYLQIYTSGTTGRPKGVVLSEANCLGHLMGVMLAADVELLPGQRFYAGLPLFHVGGVFAALWALARGTTLIFRRDFDPAEVERLMADGGVDHASLVPAMLRACVAQPPDPARAFGELKTVMYGASPIAPELLRLAARKYSCGFFQVYGMTETHAVIAALGVADHVRALSDRPELSMSAGRAVPGCALHIVDADGQACLPGVVGEICVRSQQVMAGYWRRPDASAEVLRDGWLHTGDAGYVDAEGYVFIVDRLKDIIVSGGENVASTEVEHVLTSAPGVADAAVIGVPDERWGEAVKAIVVSAGPPLDVDRLLQHCREHLGGFKIPRSVEFVDVIPRNGAGKILKTVLREPYWRDQQRRVG